MIDFAIKHGPLRLRPGLGQAAAVRIVLSDDRGRAVPGAEISAWSGGTSVASGITDSSGEVALPLESGSYDLRTIFGSQGYTLWSKIAPDDIARGSTVFIKAPVCSGQQILTTSEMIALLAGGVITGAGYYWKFGPAKIAGETLIAASIFTSLYRLSCL